MTIMYWSDIERKYSNGLRYYQPTILETKKECG